jgi:pyridoxine kinase
MTAITVIVAMDPHNGWYHQVFPVDLDILKAQLETIVVGAGVDAMKTGMLPTADIIELAAQTIKKHGIKNVVVDPVMVCKGANEPLNPENTDSFKDALLPLATVVTPNNFEAMQLSGMDAIDTLDDMKEAARIIQGLGCGCVVVKGGKGSDKEKALDVVYDGKDFEVIESERIDTPYVHGAGCTFSAAIAAELAKGADTRSAILTAKRFVTEAIRHSFRLNQFVGPTDHGAYKRGGGA